MISMLARSRVRREATQWLSGANLNVFVTVTLKRYRLTPLGAVQYIDDSEARRTAEIVRDRVLNKISKHTNVDREELPFYIFFECGSNGWHPHFHIASAIPNGMDVDEYDKIFRATVGHLHWINEQIDIKPITYSNENGWQGVCHYSLKSGMDAFLPEASNIPKSLRDRGRG